MVRLTRPILSSVARATLGEDIAAATLTDVLDRTFEDYEARSQDLPDEALLGPRLMVHLAALTAAFYRALLGAGLPAAEARSQTGRVTAAIYEKMGEVPWALSRLSGEEPRARLKSATDLFRRFPFSAPGYEMVDVPSAEDVVAFDVRRCPVASYLRAEGLGELCVDTWCSLDFALAQQWGSRLERTETLAEGAERCDFRWHVESALPEGIE